MLAALSLLAATAVTTPDVVSTKDTTIGSHRISFATGAGEMLNDVQEDGHGSSGGFAFGGRLAYDYAFTRWFELGGGLEVAHVDARAPTVFIPSLRARAHLDFARYELGFSVKALLLASLLTNERSYVSNETHTNLWTGFGAGAALDFRAWIADGNTAIELSPEIDVAQAHANADGSYLRDNLAHASLMLWAGIVRRF